MIKGVDISEWNGQSFNVNAYKFVIIRLGYGLASYDKQFKNNIDKCIKNNIPFGIYFFSEAVNVQDAVKEANFTIEALKPYKDKISVGVWYDIEPSVWKTNHHFNPSKDGNNIAYEYCSRVEAQGYYTGIYCSKSWLPYFNKCERFDKWVASWGVNDGNVNDNTSNLGSILQYTSKLGGSNLDGDIIYADNFDRYKKRKEAVKITSHKELITELANRVIKGEFGNGDDRKKVLGGLYGEVQDKVNQLIKGGN